LWYEDFYLSPIWHWEGLRQDDNMPLGVAFISHVWLSPVDASMRGQFSG
jgi:hypothetical protein